MADLSYTVGVNTSGANAALTSLQSKVSGLTASFGKLQSAIAGLAVGAAIANAIKYADAINDIKNATGIAVQNIAGFSKAVQLNGGDAEKAQASILKLVQSIDDAASGSDKTQKAFAQVGVSLNDLRNLSEQDLLAKVIRGLSGIDDYSKRAALATDLLGKSIKGVDIRGVAAGLDSATAGSASYAASIEKAAALQDKLDMSMDKFRMSVLKAIEPLADFVNKLDQEKVDKFIDAVVNIGGAAVAIAAVGTAISKVVGWVAAAGTAALALWATFKVGALQAASTVAGLGIRWGGFIKGLSQAVGFIASFKEVWTFLSNTILKTIPFFIGGILRMLGPIGIAITAIQLIDFAIKKAFDFSPIDWFIGKVGDAYNAFKKFIGLKSGTPEAPAAGTPAQEFKTTDPAARALRQTGDAGMTKPKRDVAISDAAKALAEAIAKQRREMVKMTDEYIKQNGEVRNTIDLDSMLIGKSKDFADVTRAQAELAARTRDKIDELTNAKANLTAEEKKAGLGAEYDKQIAKVQELSAAESARIKITIDANNRLLSIEQLRLYGIQREIDLQNQIISVQDTIAKSTLTEIEKKYYDIDAAAKASAKSAIEAEEARIGRKLNASEVKAYYDAAIKGAEDLKAIVDQEYKNSRDFSTGWAQAFNEYADNATNAAQRAKDIFNQATSGMSDMIVNFAKTGKFEWRGFVNDMLTTLLKSQLQQTITSIFSRMGGAKAASGKSGGLFGGSLIPGFLASGGPASSNRSYIVGERGPELFTPSSNGTVTPNSAFGGQNVTYNIQAVDARSFQALVAQDPSFIHAVAMAGARNTPR